MSTKSIKERAAKGRQLTKQQKLRVLKDARALLGERWTNDTWVKTILGVEHYCLYGAVEKVCGLDPNDNEGADEMVSKCSLTSTMFEAIPKLNKHRLRALHKIEQTRINNENDIKRYTNKGYDPYDYALSELELDEEIMRIKVQALQSINDGQGRAAVLRVLDKAIRGLEG